MNNIGKWIYEEYGKENWNYEEEFNTKEEAIAAGRKFFNEEYESYWDESYDYSKFSVGQIAPIICYIDSSNIIDQISENAYDQVGDIADGWLYPLKSEELDKLSNMLTETFLKWMKETNNEPKFFAIDHVEDIDLEDKDGDID